MEWYMIFVYGGLLFGAYNSYKNYKLQKAWFNIMHPEHKDKY